MLCQQIDSCKRFDFSFTFILRKKDVSDRYRSLVWPQKISAHANQDFLKIPLFYALSLFAFDTTCFSSGDYRSAGGLQKGRSDAPIDSFIHYLSCSLFLSLSFFPLSVSLFLFFKAISSALLLVSGCLGHPSLRICKSCFGI